MTLTIQDLGALGELLGSIAVLATLVYLALQTRQNTMAIAAQLDAARLDASLTVNLALADSSELVEALAEDSTVDITTEQMRLASYWTSHLFTYQWQLIQAHRGLLPTFNEEGVRRSVGILFTMSRSFEGWWEFSRGLYLPDFVEFVEEQRPKAA